MHARGIDALERWAAEQEHVDDVAEVEPLVRRLHELLETEEGDDPINWDGLARSADRIGRRGATPAARGAARTLLALLEGDARIVEALLPEPAPLVPARGSTRRWSPGGRTLAVLGVLGAAALVGGIQLAKSLTTPRLAVSGPAAGAQLGSATAGSVSFSSPGGRRELQAQRWRLDGRDVTHAVVDQSGRLVFYPHRLSPGRHVVDVTAGGGFLGATAHRHFSFVVDLTPPSLAVAPTTFGRSGKPVEIRGSADPTARVTIAGRPAANDDGRFAAVLRPPLPARVPVVATDEAGNQTAAVVTVWLTPRRPPVPVRAVHVTGAAWANATLRRQILQLIAERRITAVELDLKDEAGVVDFAGVPAAGRIGATRPFYDLSATVRQLHRLGVRVIGRLVCFRDPIAAAAWWSSGHHSRVVQTPDGQPYAGYGGFTNFANPAVRRYQIAIAVAAARRGVDDILYDYVRRPDGDISTMAFPGLRETPSQAIIEFLRESREALKPYGTYLGASVFGIAATRPDEVAQDIPEMAREVDYLSPLVYPSHWNDGEYDVPYPNLQPYLIVKRSLADFRAAVAGTGARLVPWLQDFSLGVTYGPAQVKAQIAAAKSRRDRRVPALGRRGDLRPDGPRPGGARAHGRGGGRLVALVT